MNSQQSSNEGVPVGTIDLITGLKSAIRDSGPVNDLAKRAGVARTSIQRFMNSERALNLETAAKVATTLGYELKRSRGPIPGHGGLAIHNDAEMLIAYIDANILPIALIGASPVPAFCTELKTGIIQFINSAFAQIFSFETPEEMLRAYANVTSFYRATKDRASWISFMTKSQRSGSHFSPTYVLDLFNRRKRQRISIAETAMLLDVGGAQYALGFALDITEHQLRSEKRACLLDAFDGLLNDDAFTLGVHTLIRDGNDIFVKQMNRRACTLLGLSEKWYDHIGTISDLEGTSTALEDAASRLSGEAELRLNRYCTYTTPGRKDVTIPVIINEYGVRDPAAAIEADVLKSRRLCGIVTTVRSARIPPDIVKLLATYGPRNPMLEVAGVQTIVKTRAAATTAEPGFVFQFVNLPLKQRLVRRRKLKERLTQQEEHGVKYDADGFELIDGKTEEELFGNHGHGYKQTDEAVYRDGVIVQQIEDHPVVGTSEMLDESQITTEVHVIKMPHKGAAGKVDGVEVFFWEISKEKEVFQNLRKAYRPWNYLDDIQVPLYRKDASLRFIYCNNAYLEDIRGISTRTISTVRDLIGLRDWEIHDPKHAELYEQDDHNLIANPSMPIERIERHGDYWVKVMKTAITSTLPFNDTVPFDEFARSRPQRVVAIQGIFWKLDPHEMRRFLQVADEEI